MLKNTKSGFLLYFSCILASVTVGFFCRFLSDSKTEKVKHLTKPTKNSFVKSVSSGSEGMFSVCGWVLIFCIFSSLCDALKLPFTVSNIIKAVGEVTTGCKNAIAANLSVPVLAGILGFGGFAVICQCATYASACKTDIKQLICSRLINSSLSAIYCSFLLKLFPQCENVSVVIGSGTTIFTLYHSFGASVILLIMCVLLILEVDNRKKVC